MNGSPIAQPPRDGFTQDAGFRAGEAQLNLVVGIGADGGTSILRRHVAWPWSLPRGFRLAGPGGPLTVLPQGAAAALLPGDHWRHRVTLGPGAALHLISAGAMPVHAEPAKPSPRLSRSDWSLRVGAGAALSHVPDPYVLMTGAQVSQALVADLARDAVFVLFDGFCRRNPQDAAQGGSWFSDILIRREGGPVLMRDRQCVTEADLLRLRALPGQAAAFGTAVIVAPPARLAPVQAMLSQGPWLAAGVYGAVGALRQGQGLILRLAAVSGGALTDAFDALRDQLRPMF